LAFFTASALSFLRFRIVLFPKPWIRAGVVVPVPFEQVDYAPYREARAEGDYQGFQGVNCACKKLHKSFSFSLYTVMWATKKARILAWYSQNPGIHMGGKTDAPPSI
jgi:hypothetical protein